MIENYLDLYLNENFPNNTPESLIALATLSFGRLFPIITQASFFGAKVAPKPVKVVLAFVLFVIFLPQLLFVTKTPLVFNLNLMILLIKEIFIGFSIGLLVSIPFIIVQNVGMIIDHQRGGASLMVNDPTIQNQSSPLGLLFNYVLIFLFYELNGPFIFLDAILDSFTLIPPDTYLNREFFQANSPFWHLTIILLNQVMKITIQLASPALCIILMTDVFLGIANRLAPQVQITFLGMPLKSLLGLTIITIGWKLLANQMIIETKNWLGILRQAVEWMSFGGV